MSSNLPNYYKIVDLRSGYSLEDQLQIIKHELEQCGYRVLNPKGYLILEGNVADMKVYLALKRVEVEFTNDKDKIIMEENGMMSDSYYDIVLEKSKTKIRLYFPPMLEHTDNGLIIEFSSPADHEDAEDTGIISLPINR